MPPAPPPGDVMRIFVSTDNHVGYEEKDLVRANDSFGAFEEVLITANHCHSDMLLLGGDLFHDNKPSRSCMVKTMQLLKKHCMGDAAVQLMPVDVTSMGFEDDEEPAMVNYDDPNLNISLPVFIIHGNHDDPSGDGQYSALDILSTAGLINYFGKQKNFEELVIKPLLLSKGNVSIALYGLGNIRDERLYQTMKSKKVNWMKPEDSDDKYFNILVIHQNKVEGRKNSTHIEWIPKWMDLIVWGHEHECIIDPRKEGPNDVYVMQPGSTVATSLIKGESERKHMAYLDIKLNPQQGTPLWKCTKLAMRYVRPFVYEEICLQASDCGPTEEDVKRFLQEEVDKLLERAEEEFPNVPASLRQPLVRLKVEHTGFPQLHSRRFGQMYAGQKPEDWKVANPLDIVSFWRRRKTAELAPRKDRGDEDEQEDVEAMLEAPEIEKLVDEELEKGPKQMEVLNRYDLAEAVNNFVHKEEAKAISLCVESQLKDAEKDLFQPDEGGVAIPDDADPEALKKDVLEKLNHRQQQKLAEAQNQPDRIKKRHDVDLSRPRSQEGDDDDGEHTPPPRARGAGGRAGGASKAAPKGGRGRGGAASKETHDSGEDSFNDDHVDKPAGRGRGRGKGKAPAKPRAAAKGRGAAAFDPSQSQLSFAPNSQSQSQARPKRKAAAPKSYEDPDEDDEGGGDGGAAHDDAEEAFENSKRQKRARRHESDDD